MSWEKIRTHNREIKKLLILSPHPNDGTSWWRAIGPMAALTRKLEQYGVQVDFTRKDLGWSDLAFYDAVFFQRPADSGSVQLATLAKEMGLKIWCDYDDNLVEVPYANPAFKTYDAPKMKQDVSRMVQNADVVTVTTRELKRRFSVLNPNIYVVPNALDDRVLAEAKPDKNMDSRLIMWRGSRTHDEDLMEYIDPILEIANKHAAWRWAFVGDPYFMLRTKMPQNRTIFMEALHLPKFYHFLAEMNSEIGIVPLADNAFNQCKSNIGWQEYTYMGGATLGPAFEEWDVPGCQNYTSAEDFYDMLDKMVVSKEMRRDAAETSRHYLDGHLRLSQVNEIRFELVMQLLFEPSGVQLGGEHTRYDSDRRPGIEKAYQHRESKNSGQTHSRFGQRSRSAG